MTPSAGNGVRTPLRRLAFAGVLCALSCALSVLENLLPALPVPGARLGLANIAVTAALFWLGVPYAAGVGCAKCLTVWLTRGGMAAVYSVCGTALSLLAMTVMRPLYRRGLVSMVGVSVAGAAAHTAGQLLCVRVLSDMTARALVFPLTLLSAASGVLTGVALNLLMPRVEKALARSVE